MRWLGALLLALAMAPRAVASAPRDTRFDVAFDESGGAHLFLRIAGRSTESLVVSTDESVHLADLSEAARWIEGGPGAFVLYWGTALTVAGVEVSGRIGFAPVLRALRRARVRSVRVDVRLPHALHAQGDGLGLTASRDVDGLYYAGTVDTDRTDAVWACSFGYPRSHVAWVLALGAILLVVPIGATLRRRRIELRRLDADPHAATWYRYVAFNRGIVRTTWLVWGIGASWLDLVGFAPFAFRSSIAGLAGGALLILAASPLLVTLACRGLSFAMFLRASG